MINQEVPSLFKMFDRCAETSNKIIFWKGQYIAFNLKWGVHSCNSSSHPSPHRRGDVTCGALKVAGNATVEVQYTIKLLLLLLQWQAWDSFLNAF